MQVPESKERRMSLVQSGEPWQMFDEACKNLTRK